MRGKCKLLVVSFLLTVFSTHAAELLSVDFESDTVGASPIADYVSPDPSDATNFVTVVSNSVNTAGTGNGVELYDNGTATGSRLAYDFSIGESAVRFDISLAQLLDTGSAGRYYSVCILANGASPTSSGNRYAEVRVYDNGTLRYYDNGAYVGGGKTDYMVFGTAATLSLFVNDSDSAIDNYQPGYSLAANSVDYWLDGIYWGTGALLASLSDTTTSALGRVAIASGSSDVLMDYVFDDIVVSTVIELPPPAYLLDVDFESDTEGSEPAANDLSPSSNTADNFNKVINSTMNKAGTGQGMEFYDNNASVGTRLGYDFSLGETAIRYDFSLAPLATNEMGHYAAVCVLANGASAAVGANRYAEVRIYDKGAARFYSAGSYISSSEVPLILDTSTTISLFVNDGDTAISYNGGASTLEANSVDYWVDGAFHVSGDLNALSSGTTNGLGRIGVASSTSYVGLDYAFDDLKVSIITNGFETNSPSGYSAWLDLYPALGSFTNYTDDAEPDGLNNLLEYALGGDPTSDDAAAILPTSSLSTEGGTNWLNYVYNRNVDASNLTYSVSSTLDLVTGPITNATQEVGASAVVDGFQTVTNRILIDTQTKQFMGLKVEVTP